MKSGNGKNDFGLVEEKGKRGKERSKSLPKKVFVNEGQGGKGSWVVPGK